MYRLVCILEKDGHDPKTISSLIEFDDTLQKLVIIKPRDAEKTMIKTNRGYRWKLLPFGLLSLQIIYF